MRTIATVACLGLVWLLALGQVSAATVSTVYLAEAQATIDIAEDGSVSAVDLRRTPALEGEVGERLEARIRDWRFEPILDEAGEAVSARTVARMTLEATLSDDDGLVVRTQRPNFSKRGLGRRPQDADWEIEGKTIERVLPQYPSRAQHVAARIVLHVRYDASGAVTATGVHTAQLLDLRINENDAPRAETLLRPFVRSAQRALARWRFPETTHGGQALVPIQFATFGESREQLEWRMAVNVAALEDARPVAGGDTPGELAMLADDDSAFSVVKLVTPVEDELL